MSDDQITVILVAIARLEEKVNQLVEQRVRDATAIEKLKSSDAGLSAIKSFLLAAPGVLSLIVWAILMFRGG